ncbi:uncharacterized protein LOC142321596 [Lycorma delicatula]|uniref:uncharacterized protein LOC142321596 n=1 Tax=Lycorma delicatula TaxID=130591 RepID=UPI003F50E9F5
MAMKLQKISEGEEKSDQYILWILTVVCLILLMSLLGTLYLLFICNEYKLYSKAKDNFAEDDEIKLQLYLLESNYYLDEIDKEETKISSMSKEYNMAKRYALTREPRCAKQLVSKEELEEYKKIETMAEESLKYFKHILSSWNDNIDYMDIDKTLISLLDQYQKIYFDEGDWKEEKVDKRSNAIKDFYNGEIVIMETCTTPSDASKDDLDKLNHVRKQISIIDAELEEKLAKLDKLDEEIIVTVNSVLPVNVRCLHYFPEEWERIQMEEALAKREIDVLKFKLKQIRYKLMIADTKEKLDFLVKWEENFSKNKQERYKYSIDDYYEKAEILKNNLIKYIVKCSKTENV